MVLKSCKCGHDKKSHGRIFKICQHCPCTSFMNRDIHNTKSKVLNVIGWVGIALVLFIIASTYMGLHEILDVASPETLAAPAVNFEDMVVNTMNLVLIFGVVYVGLVIIPAITEMYLQKKRKDWN